MLHGGEIYNLGKIEYDFSVNTNPLGIPAEVCARLAENLPLLQQYPDQECSRLRQALSVFTGVPADRILCGNGASALIVEAVRAIRPKRILITAPSFSGYRHAAIGAGAVIREHFLKREEDFALTERFLEDLEKEQPDLVILASPNNPVGNLIDPDILREILEICAHKNIWLMLDECFLCFTGNEESLTLRRVLGAHREPGEKSGKLLVLDAFTKRFAMPGIRLGYIMADDPEIMEKIREQQAEWSVSFPAQIAGLAALETDPSYMEEAVKLVAEERQRMVRALSGFGFRVYLGEANFVFFSVGEDRRDDPGREKKPDLQKLLLDQGILIRSCENYPGLARGDYRVAVRLPEENTVLLEAIKRVLPDLQ